jgi:hypothetical protein
VDDAIGVDSDARERRNAGIGLRASKSKAKMGEN